MFILRLVHRYVVYLRHSGNLSGGTFTVEFSRAFEVTVREPLAIGYVL